MSGFEDIESGDELDELETSVAMENDEFLIDSSVVPPDATMEVEIPQDPIIQEFGFDGGIINVLKTDGECFFYVESSGPIEPEASYFHSIGHLWQGLKVLPLRFDDAGVELESDEDDPAAIYAELYVPKWTVEAEGTVLYDYLQRGGAAVRNLFFPSGQTRVDANNGDTVQVDVQVDESKASDSVTKDTISPSDSGKTITIKLDTKGLEDSVLKAAELKKSAAEKKEDSSQKLKDLAELVFKDTDAFVPAREKVTLVLSEPILPATVGMLKKDRRLTPTTWNKLRLEQYNLSPEQNEQLSQLSRLASTEQEETVLAGLAPALVKALSSLIKKNVSYHLPTIKMFDLIWRANSSNTSTFATPVKTLPEAQAFIDSLLEVVQHQIMTHNLLSHQMKLQIGNIMSGLAKDSITSKVMQKKFQENLDNDPAHGVMGNLTKTVADLEKTKKSLSKGGIMMLGKRGAQDIPLTASTQNKKQKLYSLSMRDKVDKFFNKDQGSLYKENPKKYGNRGTGQGPSRGQPRKGFQFNGGQFGGNQPSGRGGQAPQRGRGGGGGGKGGRGSQRGNGHRY